jgi:ABC-2 type transport system ATP-binding protein
VHAGNDGELVVRGVEIAEIGDRACAAGIALHELTPQAGSLEELFMGWTSTADTRSSPEQTPRDTPSSTHVDGADTAEVAETGRQVVAL